MEFGVFVGMYHPNHRRAQGETEQDVLRAELDVVQAADRSGFKYAWATEHHFLDEYSHLSANESCLAYLAGVTDNIHIGSGIINITPPVNHPARVAERVAMLDHLRAGPLRVRHRRGSSSTEGRLRHRPTDLTSDMFDEALPQIVKMWARRRLPRTRAGSSRCHAATCCPSRSPGPHPPLWVAAGQRARFEKAARMGIGVLCFSSRAPRRSSR